MCGVQKTFHIRCCCKYDTLKLLNTLYHIFFFLSLALYPAAAAATLASIAFVVIFVVVADFERGKYVHKFVLVFVYGCINDVDVAVFVFNVDICKYQYQRTRMRYFV